MILNHAEELGFTAEQRVHVIQTNTKHNQ